MDEICDFVKLSSPKHFKILTDGIWSLYKKKEWADLMMKVGGNDIMMHTFMLAIFAPKLLEHCEDNKCDLPHINIEKRVINAIVEFIYTGEVNVIKDDLDDLKRGAEQFGLQILIEIIDKQTSTKQVKKKLRKVIPIVDDRVVINEVINLDEYQPYSVEIEVSNCESQTLNVDDEVNWRSNGNAKESWKTTMMCPHCDYQAENAIECLKHISDVHQVHTIAKCDPNEFLGDIQRRSADTFSCEICDKTFHNAAILKSHVNVFHCQPQTADDEMCDAAPAKQAREISKSCKCDLCGRVCKSKSQLVDHVNFKHRGEKNYICETCGARLGTRETLRTHSLLHKPDEAVKCPVCDKKYSLPRYLMRHMRLVHWCSVKVHTCDLCSFVTKVKDNLNKHVKRIHGIGDDEEEDKEEETTTKTKKKKKVEEEEKVCVLSEVLPDCDVADEIELAVEYLHSDI